MLPRKFIRENIDLLRDSFSRMKNPELNNILDSFLEKDNLWRLKKSELDSLRSERNKLSKMINDYKKNNKDIADLIEKAKYLPKKIKLLEDEIKVLEDEIDNLRKKIPNIISEEVPFGLSEEDNKVVEEHKIKNYSFKPLNHVELCEKQDWADFEASAKASGKGFYFLKNELALLNRALIDYAIDKLKSKGYNYIEPPLLLRKKFLDAAMDTDSFKESIYQIKDSDLCLIGTSEHSLLAMHANQVIRKKDLPKKYVAYSMCFRQEIGSHGINEKGLWRTHQFNKVEQFIYANPEDSEFYYKELYNNSKEILEELGLDYRIVIICTGDLAVWKYKSHDFEVWRPTINEYKEVMSLSNCTIYQSADLNIKNDSGEFLHTLNNTAIATSRIMVAILEQYQNKDGTVNIPKVLQKYIGKKVIGKPIR